MCAQTCWTTPKDDPLPIIKIRISLGISSMNTCFFRSCCFFFITSCRYCLPYVPRLVTTPVYDPFGLINVRPVIDGKVRAFPPANGATFNPSADSNVPMVPAYGFIYCVKLGLNDPKAAAHNANSVACCALGKPQPWSHQDSGCSFVLNF